MLTRRPRAEMLTFLALSLAGGCDKDPQDDPCWAVRTLLQHLRTARYDAAWPLLVEEDQTELMNRHRTLARVQGKAPEESPEAALRAFDIWVPSEPDNVTLASRPGNVVRVRVTVQEGQGATFEVRRTGDGWRVALLASLEPEDPVEPEDPAPVPSSVADPQAPEGYDPGHGAHEEPQAPSSPPGKEPAPEVPEVPASVQTSSST